MIQKTNSLEESSTNCLKVENWASRSEAITEPFLNETRDSRNRQDPDVIIRLYKGAQGAGHIGIKVIPVDVKSTDEIKTEGFYPKKMGWFTPTGHSVPGEIKTDENEVIKEVRLKTTPEQDKKIQEAIDKAKKDTPFYNLYIKNCSQVVGKFLRAGGVYGPDIMLPKEFIKALEDYNKTSKHLNDNRENMKNPPSLEPTPVDNAQYVNPKFNSVIKKINNPPPNNSSHKVGQGIN